MLRKGPSEEKLSWLIFAEPQTRLNLEKMNNLIVKQNKVKKWNEKSLEGQNDEKSV